MLETKKKPDVHIFVWVHNQRIYKACINTSRKSITIYDENDNVLMKRVGVPNLQINEIERRIKFSSLFP